MQLCFRDNWYHGHQKPNKTRCFRAQTSSFLRLRTKRSGVRIPSGTPKKSPETVVVSGLLLCGCGEVPCGKVQLLCNFALNGFTAFEGASSPLLQRRYCPVALLLARGVCLKGAYRCSWSSGNRRGQRSSWSAARPFRPPSTS